MNFFTNLINKYSEESSKRFMALYFSGWFTVVIVCSLFGVPIQDSIVTGLIVLITGQSALTVLNKPKEPKYKEDNKY